MVFKKTITIGNAVISEDSKTFIIAEAGVNHNGSMIRAKQLIDEAAKSGADAVKFQAFKTEELILQGTKKAPYQLKTSNAEESQFAMLKQLELSCKQLKELQRYANMKKIIFLVTPFDGRSLEELDALHLPAYKISSTDATNIPFLKTVAKRKVPIILSTGMTHRNEIALALASIYPYNKNIILLQCGANYPLSDREVNLRVIETLKISFGIIVGFSDHTYGIGAAPYAVAAGAKLLEKHFTLNRKLPGPDHRASLEPAELKALVKEIRRVEQFMGSAKKEPTISEKQTRKMLQKCFVARKQITKGEIFNEANLVAKRTGGRGISPIRFRALFGKKSKKEFKINEVITL